MTALKLKFCEVTNILNADILLTTFCALIKIKVQQNQIVFSKNLLLVLLKVMVILFILLRTFKLNALLCKAVKSFRHACALIKMFTHVEARVAVAFA